MSKKRDNRPNEDYGSSQVQTKRPRVYGTALDLETDDSFNWDMESSLPNTSSSVRNNTSVISSRDSNAPDTIDAGITQEFELMGNPDILIRIPDHHQLLLPLKGCTPVIHFKIQSDPGANRPGLEMSSIDDCMACIQLAYIYCRAYINPDISKNITPEIRIGEDVLKHTLKSVEQSHFLLIGVFEDRIRLEFYDFDKGRDGTGITLPQIGPDAVADKQDFCMIPLSFAYMMPICPNQFGKVIKLISHWQSSFTEIILYRKTSDNPKWTNIYTVIASENSSLETGIVRKWFKSIVKRYVQHQENSGCNDDGQVADNSMVTINEVIEVVREDLETHISPLPSFSNMEIVYSEKFPTKYLNNFTKDLGNNALNIYLVPNGPLMMETKQGERSWLRMVVARKEKASDES